ncbi:MAG: GNAT family N-acetyltransferase [Verrucomicrobia bacterium]|nr:GNAT family N-acetyltransferase [Verrucomicrobiota bacterium]
MEREDITTNSAFELRYSTDEDANPLKNLLMDPSIQQWFPLSSEHDVDLFIRNWMNFSRYGCSLTAFYENQRVGFGSIFLLPYRKVAIHTMGYLVVDPKFQGKGVGTSLLRNLIVLSRNFKVIEKFQCEIYEDCPLVPLLTKLSFKKVFEQKGFVKEVQVGYKARCMFERSNQDPV